MPHEVLLLSSTDGGDQLTAPVTGVQNKLHVVPYYWDPNGLTYVVAQQAGGGTGGGGDASAANQTTEISKLTSIDGKTPALGQALAAASLPVVLTAAQLSTLTPLSSVSVSNFPASQTVAGSVSVSNFPATQPVSIAATVGVSGPLTDTQLRASAVPVSLASVPSHAVTNAGTFAVQVTSAPTTAVTGTFFQATQPVSNAGVFVVQEEKVGRASVNMFAEAVAGIIAETAITMSYSKANATVTTGTSFTPTSGKTLRLTSLIVSWVSTATTANTCRLRARVNASGAATTSSPIQFSARIAWESPTFIANEGEFQQIPIPDGLEVPNGGGIMWTLACVAANGTLDVSALGFEYTP